MDRSYYCSYRDGTVKEKLSYDESLKLFNESFHTDNPCAIFITKEEYKEP